MPGASFDLSALPHSPLARAAVTVARPLLRTLLGLREIEAIYRRIPSAGPDMFAPLALDALGITASCDRSSLARIPTTGPLIVAANHPHGALDGLLLLDLVRRVRTDVRSLANLWLAAVPELTASCFFVDPFGGPGAAARSRTGLRAARLWLQHGGALIVFPAGAVAHERDRRGKPVDGPWKPTVGRLAVATGATVLPVHLDGGNRAAFYRAGSIHAALRTALLGRELLARRGAVIRVSIGAAIATANEPLADGRTATAAIRSRVDALPCVDTEGALANEITEEVDRLPDSSCLVTSGAFRVFCCSADQIPRTLMEIGRLRAVTYRAVGEGSGSNRDLDVFDAHYLHLFSWDTAARRIVGAYRLGRTDAILNTRGERGLYTRTLFGYDRSLLERMGPTLELGRSFVRAEYQRHHSALLLLWKGIGRFVARHPEYRMLFGPVSISARYTAQSHGLLMAFLEREHHAGEWAPLVSALNPPARQAHHECVPLETPRTVDEASRRVAAIEPDGKGMPVLLRQYLKLNARMLAFSVDPHFGDALDALMVVDLATVDPPLLARYFGREEARHLIATHTDNRGAAEAA